VTSAQLREAGVTEAGRRALVESGVLRRVSRGLFVLTGSEQDWRCSMWLALLSAGSGAFICQRSAAGLWGLDGVSCHSDQVDVAVPPGRHPRRPGTIRLTAVGAGDIASNNGFPLTTVRRTLLDLGRVVDAGVVERSLECALRRRLVSIGDVTQMAELARARGATVLRGVLGARPEGAPPTESDWETVFVQVVRSMGLPNPRRQFTVILRGRKYRLDFAWPALRLAVEIDGASVHGPGALGADLYRQNQILLDGWLVLRFTPYMVGRETRVVMRDLRAAWELRSTVAAWK